jgi:hypothetical protein
VLVAGGGTGGESVTASAEVYDPAGDRWSLVAPMSTPRVEASALLLRNSRVLVAGGTDKVANQDGSLDSAELYNPGSDSWSPTPRMPAAHAGADATVLGDGRALVAGGFDYQGGFGIAVPATDIYNPVANRWSSGPPLLVPRGLAGSAMLSDGRFLVVGGISRSSASAESSAELFDPAARTWILLPRLPDDRIGATVTALPDGRALVVGGGRLQVAELFVPAPPAALGQDTTLGAAIGQNRILVAATGLLLLLVAGQAAWRRFQAG